MESPKEPEEKKSPFWTLALVLGVLYGAYSVGYSDGKGAAPAPVYYSYAEPVEAEATPIAAPYFPTYRPQATSAEIAVPVASTEAVSPSEAASDAEFAGLFSTWKGLDQAGRDGERAEPQQASAEVATEQEALTPQAFVSRATVLPSLPAQSARSLSPAAPALPRYGCAENGSCYGDISATTGAPKTVFVQGYYRSDGTYVRGYYRSK